MNSFQIKAPSRLHFGLLARGPSAPRQFGGLGLMIEQPGVEIYAEFAGEWSATGPLADRVLRVASDVAAEMSRSGRESRALSFQVVRVAPQHAGLGTGTQLSLAVARLVATSIGWNDASVHELATLCGRGLRSGVGIHGFDAGGLVVEGGHKGDGGIAPLLSRLEFPPEWSALVVMPTSSEGLHGPDELHAFASLPSMPESETDRLCRLVLLGVLPSVAERDLDGFGSSLEEIQHRVGSWFAPAQGGVFASRRSEEIVDWLRREGLKGAGQSSWGPTLYGFTDRDTEWQDQVLARLQSRFDLAFPGIWTKASQYGAVLTH